jgi:hypothetical protein
LGTYSARVFLTHSHIYIHTDIPSFWHFPVLVRISWNFHILSTPGWMCICSVYIYIWVNYNNLRSRLNPGIVVRGIIPRSLISGLWTIVICPIYTIWFFNVANWNITILSREIMKQFIYKWAIVRRYLKYITRGIYKVYNPQKDSGIYYGIYTYIICIVLLIVTPYLPSVVIRDSDIVTLASYH